MTIMSLGPCVLIFLICSVYVLGLPRFGYSNDTINNFQGGDDVQNTDNHEKTQYASGENIQDDEVAHTGENLKDSEDHEGYRPVENLSVKLKNKDILNERPTSRHGMVKVPIEDWYELLSEGEEAALNFLKPVEFYEAIFPSVRLCEIDEEGGRVNGRGNGRGVDRENRDKIESVPFPGNQKINAEGPPNLTNSNINGPPSSIPSNPKSNNQGPPSSLPDNQKPNLQGPPSSLPDNQKPNFQGPPSSLPANQKPNLQGPPAPLHSGQNTNSQDSPLHSDNNLSVLGPSQSDQIPTIQGPSISLPSDQNPNIQDPTEPLLDSQQPSVTESPLSYKPSSTSSSPSSDDEQPNAQDPSSPNNQGPAVKNQPSENDQQTNVKDQTPPDDHKPDVVETENPSSILQQYGALFRQTLYCYPYEQFCAIRANQMINREWRPAMYKFKLLDPCWNAYKSLLPQFEGGAGNDERSIRVPTPTLPALSTESASDIVTSTEKKKEEGRRGSSGVTREAQASSGRRLCTHSFIILPVVALLYRSKDCVRFPPVATQFGIFD